MGKTKNIILAVFVLFSLFITFIYLRKPNSNSPLPVQIRNMMIITSPAFKQNEVIPKQYSCDGEDVNPPLTIVNIPNNAKSLVLIVDDPDAPAGVWTHWLVWNIDPKTTEIKENSTSVNAVVGKNDFGKLEYGGPCPPGGTHRYFFKVYALDMVLDLPQGANRSQLNQAMESHIINKRELMGTYSK